MADINKTIKDLDEQIAWIQDNDFHKFPGWGYAVLAMKDALELLKAEQEKKGKWKTVHYLSYLHDFKRCTCCGYICQGWDGETGVVYNYCPDCGAEMENGDINRKRAENPIITALKERYREDGEQE